MRSCGTILLALAATAFGQSYDLSPLDPLFTQAAADVPPGLQVLIVQNGQQLYWKQFGRWPRNNQVAIASGTKWYSGALIMSLVDSGLLSLDDKASKYVPYMAGEKAGITIRQLMSHTAGFPGEGATNGTCLSDPSTTLDLCARQLASLPLQISPGTGFIYAGADMQIAGRAAEVLTGRDWQTLFNERIAAPLGLTATDYQYQGPTQNPRISGGGRSTVGDYMKLLTMIYQRGVYNGQRILSARAIDAMLGDQTRGVSIIDSPYQSYAHLDPQAPANRYGIGNWLLDVDSQYRSLQNGSQGAFGWSPLIDASRNLLVVVGVHNLLANFEPYYYRMTSILQSAIPPASLIPRGITSAASYESGPLAPGEIVALFGSQLGPSTLVSQTPSGNRYGDTLAGTQVLFNGRAAPLIYTSAGQVAAIVPFEIAGQASVSVQATYNSVPTPAVPMPVAAAWPALWAADATGRGPGAVLNQDSTLNSAANPAPVGSVIQLYGTGGGLTVPPSQDGTVSCQIGDFAQPVSVTIGGVSAPAIWYSGPAPCEVAGVFQINVTIPAGVESGPAVPVVVWVGGNSSPSTVTVAIQ